MKRIIGKRNVENRWPNMAKKGREDCGEGEYVDQEQDQKILTRGILLLEFAKNFHVTHGNHEFDLRVASQRVQWTMCHGTSKMTNNSAVTGLCGEFSSRGRKTGAKHTRSHLCMTIDDPKAQ